MPQLGGPPRRTRRLQICLLKASMGRLAPVVVDDERNGFEENGILGVGVLNLLGLGRLLGFVQNSLQTFRQATPQCRVLCGQHWKDKMARLLCGVCVQFGVESKMVRRKSHDTREFGSWDFFCFFKLWPTKN